MGSSEVGGGKMIEMEAVGVRVFFFVCVCVLWPVGDENEE